MDGTSVKTAAVGVVGNYRQRSRRRWITIISILLRLHAVAQLLESLRRMETKGQAATTSSKQFGKVFL